MTAEGAREGGVDVPPGAEVFGAGAPGATAGLGPAPGGRGAWRLVLFSEVLLSAVDEAALEDLGS